LQQSGADYIALGHLHKRFDAYIGAIRQCNFGEEGNPTGFEVLTIENDTLDVRYIEINAPKFITGENLDDYNHYRTIDTVEEKTRELRTETEMSVDMSDEELLQVYMKQNPIPEGLTGKDLEQADLEASH
jgi:DNA repair exonuclease SbcCD nuclease subunit